MSTGARDVSPAPEQAAPLRPPNLGPLEEQVMNVLWLSCEVNDEPLPIRSIATQMPGSAYTTVATVLTNLHRKGMVDKLRDEKILTYRPRRGRAQHVAWEMARILDGAQNRERCLAKFAAELNPDDADTLRRILGASPVDATKPGP